METLTKLRNGDPEEFDQIVAQVQYRAREPRPLFPKDVVVADIPRIPDADVEEFKAKYVDNAYLSKEEAKKRTKSIQGTRDCQYARWKWAKSNFGTYVNMLRVCGHPDESIQAMIAGRPLCFREQQTFDDFCAALRVLKPQLEEQLATLRRERAVSDFQRHEKDTALREQLARVEHVAAAATAVANAAAGATRSVSGDDGHLLLTYVPSPPPRSPSCPAFC